MREVFQQELAEVENGLVEIAKLVRTAIEQAVSAFANSDVALAERVIAEDQRIDDRALELDELAIEILARQAPVARDLRTVVSALRMSASLERMGDLAAHIAQLARLRFPEPAVPDRMRDAFVEMGRLDIEIARTLVELVDTQDEAVAERIKAMDDRVDELHSAMFGLLNDADAEHPNSIVDATLASRYHERFADHAVSIAKKVQYLTSGEWLQPKEAQSEL
ncbi:MAG: phosphate signaling complex protein PhoU [Pseudoclavibacter sp.]|nr:phosphate signaling complex protein PhoU [Pseudoclavibacter sp.]